MQEKPQNQDGGIHLAKGLAVLLLEAAPVAGRRRDLGCKAQGGRAVGLSLVCKTSDGMVWGRGRCVGIMGACCCGPAAPPLAAASPRFTQMFLGCAVCGEASVWLCRDFWLVFFFPSAVCCPFDVLPPTPRLARGTRAGSESPGGVSRGSQLPSAPPAPLEQGWVEPPNTHHAPWHRRGATLAGGRPPSPPHRPL